MKSAIILARAKIMWGYDSTEVKQYLLDHGVSGALADSMVKEFTAERIAAVRQAGIRRIVIGSILFGLPAAYFVYRFGFSESGMGYRGARGAAVIAFVGLYGLWKLIDGVFFVTMPSTERRCITEI